RVAIDQHADRGKQLGEDLHLVEDNEPVMALEDALRVLEAPPIGHRFEIEPNRRLRLREQTRQSGLAALPRPQQRDNRRPPHGLGKAFQIGRSIKKHHGEVMLEYSELQSEFSRGYGMAAPSFPLPSAIRA